MVRLSIIKCAVISSLTISILIAIIVLRTVLYFSIPSELELCENIKGHQPITNERKLVNRFVESIKFMTITKSPKNYDRVEILRFIEFLKGSFPSINSSKLVKLEMINELSMLFTIEGSDKSLKPYLLLSHMDVVPVESDKWDVSPFDGIVKDGYIYGRGTLDLKDVLMGILESLDFILENRFPIKRSFYIAIGHDEEGRGLDGAKQIAKHMLSKGIIDFEYILDEGPFIFDGVLPGIDRRVAMIGIAEKGLVNIKLTAKGRVGHSSVPPNETPIVTLSRAVSKLDAFSHPNLFGIGPERDIIEAMAPYSSFAYKILFANLWIFKPIVSKLLTSYPLMNSFIRTTTAVTMFNSGIKDNVLPGIASAIVNHRIHPLNSVADVLNFDRELINDEQISVEIFGIPIEPHPISPYDEQSFGFQTIKKSIRQVFPSVAIIPGLMMAATDTRWYLNFTQNIYRFSPGIVSMNDLSRIHGHNERISIDNYVKLVNFYHHIMISSNDESIVLPLKKDEL